MNPDQPSRDEIEARITALLLGELPADEAALLRWTISQDAELQRLHRELASAIVLVREAEKNPAAAPGEKTVPLKLSDERRKKLLAHFQTPRPQESFWIKRLEIPSLIPVLAAIAIIALLAAMLLPALSKSKSKSAHLTMLSATKQQALEGQMVADENLPPAMPGATMPASVTVAPEPVLAPPPVQIFLPPTESPAQIAAVTGSLADSETPLIYSRSAGGWAIQNNSGAAAATPPADSIGLQTSAGDQSVTFSGQIRGVVNSFNGANTVRFGGASGGGGGGGGAGGTPGADSSSLAWHGSGANRSSVANGPANLGDELRRQTPAGTAGAGNVFGLSGAAAESPQEKLPDTALNFVAGESLVDRKLKAENSDPRFWGELQERDGDAISVGNKFYRTPTRGRADINGSFDGTLPAAAPAKPGSSTDTFLAFATDDFSKRTEESKLMDKSGNSTLDLYFEKQVAAKTALPGLQVDPVTGLPATPVAASASSSRLTPGRFKSFDGTTDAPIFLPQAGSSALTLNGENSFSGGTVINSGNLALGLNKDSVPQQLAKHDDRGLRYIYSTTNAVVEWKLGEAQKQAKSVEENKPLSYAQLSAPVLAEANQQIYTDEKRKLEQLKEGHALFASKIRAEAIDYAMPRTTMVTVTDPAEPAKSQTFWQRFNGEYASTAKIKVENDGAIMSGMSGAPAATAYGYDPYFVQTTFEIIQSDLVLSNVVEALKLDEAWAKNNGGERLKKKEAIALLKKRLVLNPVRNTKLIAITAKSDKPEEAAKIANTVAAAYQDYRIRSGQQITGKGIEVLKQQYADEAKQISAVQAEVDRLAKDSSIEPADVAIRKPVANAPIPQPEIQTRENNFSTFSLNVSDVSFKLAAASLEQGQMPDAASIRSEEFINAFDYRDPEAAAGEPIAFASERARYPFAHNRDLLRFSVKTAAAGRAAGRALNLVLLLDNSGSMERADRVAIIREALHVLATQLQPQDKVSIVTFARTARLWADGVSGQDAGAALEKIGGLTPQGGTNLEEAMRLAYETARRHYLANGLNRVVLLTDGAANLGNVDAAVLKEKVEAQRKQGIALDCFGIGWEGFNDDTLEQLSRNGDGRYAFINTPEDASKEFAAKLAGALQVAASDVKVQVEFNPQRVISYRQIGYAKHQLTKEQFRDNTVDAAEIAAQEAGNALYTVETKADGIGPIATVRVRYKVPGTTDYRERSWDVAYTGSAVSLEQSSAAMRLAATASAFSEWLASSPFAQEVTPDDLLKGIRGVPEIYGADARPKKLEWMIRQAKSLSGK